MMASTPDAVDTAQDGSMTTDAAVARAMQQHRAGNLEAARGLYEAVLAREPDRVDVLNVMGILQYQSGEIDAAIALMQRLLALRPDADGVWNNLGNALFRKGDIDAAAAAFRRSLELLPSADAWTNLARVFRRRNDMAVSEEACRQALALVPDHGPATHNLAVALLSQRRTQEGVETALKAMRLMPVGARKLKLYVMLLQVAGELDAAAVVLRAWQAQDPDNAYVRHHLAACSGEAIPERASDSYLEDVFDGFAASFDAKLAHLKYRAPQIVAEALAAALPAPARQFDIADLGCGTGLCGPLVRPWARYLAGCDLSAGMLERAAERAAYDALSREELTAFLRARPGAFDVVVSADTLNYFGELGEVAQALHGAMRVGGLATFTLEALTADEPSAYVLQPHGRYAHDPAHAARVFEAAGLRVDPPAAVVLREENEAPVHGWLMTARRVA